jgi:hypothetical protein
LQPLTGDDQPNENVTEADMADNPRGETESRQGVKELRLVVTAADYDAALAFYRDVLGLPERAAFRSPAAG